jgi:hypothetical protein
VSATAAGDGLQYQVRRYRVREGCMDAFTTLWREQIVPLREAMGFVVVGGWVLPETFEFVWIVGHEDMEVASADYYNSPARAALSPSPGSLLETVDSWPAASAL